MKDFENNNYVIAAYMGYEHPTLPNSLGLQNYTGESMEFHTSWAWLMPVMVKIASDNRCNLYGAFAKLLKYTTCIEDIDGVYFAVTRYILELNETT